MSVPPLASESDDHRRHLAVLGQVANALHGEPDLDLMISWAVTAAAELAGVRTSAFCLMPVDSSPSWTEHDPVDASFSAFGDPRSVRFFARALRRAEVLRVDDLDAEDGGAAFGRPMRLASVRTLVVVPVNASNGMLYGALFLASAEPKVITDDGFAAIEALRSHLAVALDNHAARAHLAELEARGKEVVHQLQEAVRTPPPVVPQTELGVHYVAADPSAPTGGDLYDWLLLPEGDLHIAIVDVMGKGVEATKHALIVTHALRLLAVQGCPLDEIVARADALVAAQHPDLVATLQLARYTPESGLLRLVGAGHPPALLVSNGEATEIAAPGIPIGWPGAGSHSVIELKLDRGDTLVLYTDGLIEATKDILAGLQALAHFAVETATYPARALARVLVERALADAARHDDSLAVVIRRRSPAPQERYRPLSPLMHQFSPSPAAVPVARHLLEDWLARVPVEPEATAGVLLVASELCSNAVRHASGEPGGVLLRAAVEGSDVIIEVADDGGVGLDAEPNPDELPDPETEEGRGLFLVRALADEVEADLVDGRTMVRAVHWSVVAPVDQQPVGAGV